MPSDIDRSFDEGQIRAAAYMRGFEDGKRAALAKIAKQATSLAQQTAPERIYLDVDSAVPLHQQEATWSTDPDHGIEYIRADLAQAEPAGWKPIESAPEGTLILMCDMKAHEARYWAFVDWIVNGKCCGNRFHSPTHWMPLPAAPQAPSGGEG